MKVDEPSLEATQQPTNLEDEQPLIVNDVLSTTPVIDKRRSPRFFLTVEPLFGAVFLADGLSGSVITNFILSRTCENHLHFNKSICSDLGSVRKNGTDIEALVQPYADVIITAISFLSTLLPALMSLFLGAWSDYNGRKLLLMIPVIGYTLKYILLAVFSYIPNLDSVFCLLVVLPVALSGGMVNLITAGFAYISDISNEENRSFRISIFEAFLFCGTNIGLFSSSFIFKSGGYYGYLLIFALCAGINLLAVVGVYFFLPESVQVTERGKGVWQMFEIQLLKDMFRVCFKKRDNYRRIVIFLVIMSLTITISVGQGQDNVMYLFTRLKFGWNIQDFTIWGSISLATSFLGLVSGGVVLAKWLKIPDAILGLLSYTMEAAGAFYIVLIPATAPNLMYYVGLVKLFGGLCSPAGRAVISKSVPKEDLGKVFALTGSSESLIPLVVAPLYTLLYNSTIHQLPGAFLYLSGSLYIVCCVFYLAIHFILKQSQEPEYGIVERENH